MSSTVANNCFFKELPFPVHPTQKLQLQHYKALAVAKEQALSARRKERLLQLQKYVAERIEGKKKRSSSTPAKGPTNAESARTSHANEELIRSGYPTVTTGSSSRVESVRSGLHSTSDSVDRHATTARLELVKSGHPTDLSKVELVRSGQHTTSDLVRSGQHSNLDSVRSGQHSNLDSVRSGLHTSLDLVRSGQHTTLDSVRSGHPTVTPSSRPSVLVASRTPSLTSRVKSELKAGKGLVGRGIDRGRRDMRVVHAPVKSRTPGSLLGAIARGYLTRRLFRSPKVQSMTRTIKDLLDVLATLQEPLSAPDQQLKLSTMAQLSVARHSLHAIFFNLPPSEQLLYSSTRDHHTTSRSRTPGRTPNLGGMLQNPPMLLEHSSAHSSRLPGVGLTSSSASKSAAQTNATGPHHGNRSGGVGGKLSAATIKCMQRRRARNT